MSTFLQYLKKWNLSSLSINTGFLSASIEFEEADRNAAWDMYIELLTRVTTQHLAPDHGDEKTALTSVYSLFGLTREIIKKNGPRCVNFAKLAIVILNQVIRPFTAKWHKLSLAGAFEQKEKREEFRKELADLQAVLRRYTKALADIAEVEDLTELEKET